MKLKGYRIMHLLNTARYDRNGKFLHDFDSNFKVMMKTVRFLPECHHYIVVPDRNRFTGTEDSIRKEFHLNSSNITFLYYNYTHGSASNKASFSEEGMDHMLKDFEVDYEISLNNKHLDRKISKLLDVHKNALDEKDFNDLDELRNSTKHFDGVKFKSMIKLHSMDFDFVFNHLPENHYNVLSVFGSKKYGFLINSFIFYHWVDTPGSRLNYQIYPTYMRQLEAINLCDKVFFHTTASSEYLKYNFDKDPNCTVSLNFENVRKKESYMPLASDEFPESEAFDLPVFKNNNGEEKDIILFNHRWNTTTGVDRMERYMVGLEGSCEIWSTDVKVSPSKYVKSDRLSLGQYRYLIENTLCSICFVDSYATWNLSLQDGLRLKKPVLIYKHPTFVAMLGEQYPFFFETKEEFQLLIEKVKSLRDRPFEYPVRDFESEFKTNIHKSMIECIETPKYKQESKNLKMWLFIIYQLCKENGYATKDTVLFYGTKFLSKDSGTVKDMHSESASWQFVRRQLMEFGITDDHTSKHTRYTISKDLLPRVETEIKDINFTMDFNALVKAKKVSNSVSVMNLLK